MRDYYKELNLTFRNSNNPSKKDIKNAYMKLVKKYHPDKNPNNKLNKDFNEKLQRLNEAYGILKDPIKKSSYDKDYIEIFTSNRDFNEKDIIINPYKQYRDRTKTRAKTKIKINWIAVLVVGILIFSLMSIYKRFENSKTASSRIDNFLKTSTWEGYFKGYDNDYDVTFEVTSKNSRIIFKPLHKEETTAIYSYLFSEPYINKKNGNLRMDSIENPLRKKELSIEFREENGRLIGDLILPKKKYKEDRLFLKKSNKDLENDFTINSFWKGSYEIDGVERNLFLEVLNNEVIFSFSKKYRNQDLPKGSFSLNKKSVDSKSQYIELTQKDWIDYPNTTEKYIMVDLRGIISGNSIKGNVFSRGDSIGNFTLKKTSK